MGRNKRSFGFLPTQRVTHNPLEDDARICLRQLASASHTPTAQGGSLYRNSNIPFAPIPRLKPILLEVIQAIAHAFPNSFLELGRIFAPQSRGLYVGGRLVIGARQHRYNG